MNQDIFFVGFALAQDVCRFGYLSRNDNPMSVSFETINNLPMAPANRDPIAHIAKIKAQATLSSMLFDDKSSNKFQRRNLDNI